MDDGALPRPASATARPREGRGPVCLLGSGRQRRDCGFVRVPQINGWQA
jgi:hypothetical protein